MKHLVKLNSARNCLLYLVKAYNIDKIHVPYYICPAIKRVLREANVKIFFYHIDNEFMPVGKFDESDFILYPNYFGVCNQNIKTLEEKFKNLIVDNAHSFYSEPCGLASFNSLRKFFQMRYGVMNGAYLFTEKLLDTNFDFAPDYEIDKKVTYEKIVKNENKLDEESILYMSKTTEKIMASIDFEREKANRIVFFNYYHKRFFAKNKLTFNVDESIPPFVYPCFIKNEEIVHELEAQGLHIYRYWESLPTHFPEYKFYKYLIPIPLY